ncbi:MAG: hypothetical protein K2O54_05670 [Prevotella sp.]|nr:hypothetical protein [Prevotella sp.]
MNDNKINIPVQQLVEYVKKHEVAWQMCDSLIEFSHTEEYEFTNEEQEEYEIKNNQMLSVIANAKECQMFNPDINNSIVFEDLVKWSKSKDLLILVGNELLLCIAPCDKECVLIAR